MAVLELKIDSAERDVLRIEHRALRGVRIDYRGETIGSIPSTLALREGARFNLPDGRSLFLREEAVRGFGHRLRVEIDGRLLEGCSAHPYRDIKRAGHIVLFVGVMTALFGGFALRGTAPTSATMPIAITIEGFVYIALAIGIYRREQTALLFAIILYMIDFVVMCESSSPFFMVRAMMLLWLVNGWTAFSALHALPKVDRVETFR